MMTIKEKVLGHHSPKIFGMMTIKENVLDRLVTITEVTFVTTILIFFS